MKIGKRPLWAMLLLVVVMCTAVNAQETCGPFTFTPTAESGVFVGQATISGVAADSADCVAAFDADGNCAGAVTIVINAGTAYINLPIYGDDQLTPGVDEGMNAGEDFTLALYDASADAILPMNPDTAFGCWLNTNGTPLPGSCGDFNLVHDFGVIGNPPVITCPNVAFDMGACAGRQVCVPLVIDGATSVLVQGATWANNELCFTATATGPVVFLVTAVNEFGEDACEVTINVTVTEPPVITCPEGPIDVTACAGAEVCVPLEIASGASSIVDGDGATWANGQLCFIPDSSGSYNFYVVATNDCGIDACDVTVNVTVTDPPVISCPSGPIDVNACAGDQVCLPLEIADAGNVLVEGATWANGQLCFVADATGPMTFHVVATNDCGQDTCDVTVNVTAGGVPVVDCPQVIVDITGCVGDTVCIPLAIDNATEVLVDGATWTNGMLCFTAFSSGTIQFDVLASNNCGETTCHVTVRVVLTNPPVIACPDVPFEEMSCDSGEICVPLEIAGAADVTVDGATWVGGQLCFIAEATGPRMFHVVATNDCGQDTCDVTVNVTVTDPPVISCPEVPIDTTVCAGAEICIPLEIQNADAVTADSASWADGRLCFVADQSGSYAFSVVANNQCGEDRCVVTINVAVIDPPVISCPDVPIDVTVCAGGEVCVPLEIVGATDVKVEGATWANGQLCFTPAASGPVRLWVVAVNSCGVDTCDVVVNVTITDPPVISCPDVPFDVTSCVGAEVCIPLEIAGVADVTVEGAMWADGQLCFVVDSIGSIVFHVVAANDCGETMCDISVNVSGGGGAPIINCPDSVLYVSVCAGDEVCVPLEITGADNVTVDGGTWAEGWLCIIAGAARPTVYHVVATNDCGEDVCDVRVHVTITDPPVACFDMNPTGTPLEIDFMNCTQGEEPLMFVWDFGDGTASDIFEPTHIYSEPGSYAVTLIVTDACDQADTVTHTVDVGGVTPTDRWISIYCPEPTLDGLPLHPGDVIRAFDPDGVLCGIGSVGNDGSYGLILIYADDIFTPSVDEGAEPGDEISLTVNGEDVFVDPPLIWNENGDVIMVCGFGTQTCLQYDLDAGWHLISWNVAYADDVANMIAGFENSVDAVLSFDQGGLVYVPSLAQFSTLHRVDYHFGYWFRLNSPVSFEICGGRISDGDAISIYGGWNLVSYWPEEMLPVEDALASIMDNLIVVYGFDHGTEVYEPGSVIYNSLTDMKPQFGYWVKSSAPDMLTYMGFGPVAVVGGADYATGQSDILMSSEWMSVYGSSLTVDNQALRSGAIIELVTTEGVTCGHAIYDGGLLKFTPVYGSVAVDKSTESLPEKGEKLSVLVDGEHVYPDLEYQGNGAVVQLGRLTSDANGSPGALPDDYSLSQNYPNPFNPSTSIRFNLPISEQVELTVYNLVGQKVATLVDGVMGSGRHEVEWNGTDDSGTRVASGVYLYRLNSASFTETKKMTLMK